MPTTVKPPARDRSSTVIFVCGRALGGGRSSPIDVALRTPHFRDFAPPRISHFSAPATPGRAHGRCSSFLDTKRYAWPAKQGNNYWRNRDAKWYAIGLERGSEYCIFCDRACGIDAVGKVTVFLKSQRTIGAVRRGKENSQSIIRGDSSWNDANAMI